MNKLTKNYFLIITIVAIVYNILVFVIPFGYKSNIVFYTAWGSGLLAILFQFCIAGFSFKGNKNLKSIFFGLPIIRIGLIYLIIQLSLSLLFFIVGAFVKIPFWIVLILIILVFAFALIGLITTNTYRNAVEEIDDSTKNNTAFIDNLKIEAEFLICKCIDQPIHSKIKTLYDEIKYSDPISSDYLMNIEDEINIKIFEIKDLAIEGKFGDLDKKLDNLIWLIKERNLKCRSDKK